MWGVAKGDRPGLYTSVLFERYVVRTSFLNEFSIFLTVTGILRSMTLMSRAKALGRSLNLAQVMATPEAAPQHEDVSQEDLAAPTPKPPKRLKLASCDDTPTNQPSIHSFLSPSSNSSRNSSGSVE